MEQNKIKILVNGKEILAQEGQTILEALSGAGISVPTLCSHSDLEMKSSCRICVVEIRKPFGVAQGKEKSELVSACATKIEEGMEIVTESERVRRSRKINLELLFALPLYHFKSYSTIKISYVWHILLFQFSRILVNPCSIC